jgi:serine protease
MGVSGVKNNKYDPEAGSGTEGKKYESTERVDIPDDDENGIDSEIVATDSVVPSRITVSVDISHGYIGDLKVSLKRDDVEVVLHDREGGWRENIVREYEITDERLLGKDAQGSWFLHAADHQSMDAGAILFWSIAFVP